MKHITQLLFAAALALGSASAAQAFTFEGTAPGDGAGIQRNYAAPDSQLQPKADSPQRFNSGGQDDSRRDGFSLQFGGQGQSFDRKYDSNDYFNPLRR